MGTPPFSLQEKITQLEKIEEYFQSPGMDLEQALEQHKKAMTLSKEIIYYLEKAETTIKKIDPDELFSPRSE